MRKGRFVIRAVPHGSEAVMESREIPYREQPRTEGSRVLARQIIITMIERMLEYGGDMEVRLQFDGTSYIPGLDASVAPDGYRDTLLFVPDGEPFGPGWIKEDGKRLHIEDFHDLVEAIRKRLSTNLDPAEE